MIRIITISKYIFCFVFITLIISLGNKTRAEELSGEKLFIEKRCISCHVIGRGRFAGPDLYNAISKYNEEDILSWIINPQSIYQKYSKMPMNIGYPPMPNMQVKAAEAKALVDYIKNTKKRIRKDTKVKISGKINNFTTDKLLNNQEIELKSLMADKVLFSKKIIINNGKFEFGDLKGASAYKIILMHNGIEYSTDKFYFLPTENEKKIDLTVFDTTQDKSNIKMESVHYIVTYDENSQSLVVAEIININNSSRNIYIGSNNFTDKVRQVNDYSLFSNAINLGFPHRSAETFIVSDNKLTDTLPMPPGTRRVVLTYALKLNLFSTEVSKVFINDIPNLTIIIPESKLSFDIKGLEYTRKNTNIKELSEEEYTTYSIVNIKKGDLIKLQFKKYDSLFSTKSVVGGIFILFILIAVGYRILNKRS
tara:strand:+ start:3219 stop:4487 length:1269 start_codon:yes stop_codon:yes gene_type:complete